MKRAFLILTFRIPESPFQNENEQEAGEEISEVWEKIVNFSTLHLKHPSSMWWCKLIFTHDLEVRQNDPDQLMINQLFRTLHAITDFLEEVS